MDVKHILLVALLVSATSAGPLGQRNSKCSTVCDDTQKFFYEIGKEYEYKYEAETRIAITDTLSDEATVRMSSFMTPIKVISLVLRFQGDLCDLRCRTGRWNTYVDQMNEATWVINFKKGILSNIQNSMTDLEENEVLTETDVSGICETSYSTEFKDSEIIITKTKKPSECEHKPKAHQSFSTFGYSFDSLVQGLPLLKSSQTCTQHISDEIIKKVYCEESHVFSPFEKNSQGFSSKFKGYFTTKKNLLFDHSDEDKEKLSLDKTEEILSKLNILTQNGIKKEVPALFSELVTSLRGLSQLQIQSIYQRCEKQLKTFIVDALPLVGTAESMGAIVDLILKGEITEKEKNIWFTSLGLVSNPALEMFSAVEPLLESSERTNALLGISSMIHNFCEKHEFCENERIIEKILRNFESRLGVACRSTTEEEKLEILYSLKAIGNVGRFINAEPSLKRCYLEENPMEVRVAAIDTWRRAPCSYDRDHLLSAYTDQELDNEIRISAYLGLMKCPTQEIIDTVKDRLTSEGVNQVASFVWTHLTNLQESAAFEKQWIRELIGDDLLQKKFSSGSTKMSKNFESSFYLKEQKFGASVDSNEAELKALKLTLRNFSDQTVTIQKKLFAAIIKNLRKDNNQEGSELFTKDTDEPRGSYYLKLFGNEIFYRHFEGIESLLPEKSFTSIFDLIINLLSKGSVDFTKSYNLVNAEFTYPTITGFPLRLKVDGKATIDMKLDGTFNFEGFNSINIDGKLRPSAAIMFDSSMTVDAFVSKSGMKMLSTAHSSTIIDGKALVKEGKLIDFTINVPDEKTEIFEMSNEFYKIENDVETKENTPGELYKNCSPLISSGVGLEICYEKFLPNDEEQILYSL
ncbi:Vitellogenin [Armadillidium nasatum]|uniref:Vitellogenin n=1 Tax=Armadillidium nasatum TaxID=96803 RepID=A0A5N5TJY1_9CRUS|nr:Vitellogenin [Armadillidium nasatum]